MLFDGTNQRPFTQENVQSDLELFKIIQSRPSTPNRQPWRSILIESLIRVYDAGNRAWSAFAISLAVAGIHQVSDQLTQVPTSQGQESSTISAGWFLRYHRDDHE
jgi:hypothetical protein